jgi:hypothetical protein
LSPSSIAFQPRPDHSQSERKTVTLTNDGSSDLTVTGVAVSGTDTASFLLSGDTCTNAILPSGQTCTVLVRFRPLGTDVKTASLQFTDDAPDSPQTVTLTGIGTPGPWLTRSARALRFGHQPVNTTAPVQTVTLTNEGSAPMSIIAFTLGGANTGDYTGFTQTCTALAGLDPGDSCTGRVAFRPTASGPRTATLTTIDNAPRSPHHVALTGTGT